MILIVDDDIAVQSSLSLLLKQAGFITCCASNPVEGLDMLTSEKPQVIIIDLNYGNDTSGKEGLDFLDEIRKILPSVPVILITAWASIALAVKGMKKGAFDFVSKPWNNEDLLRTIYTAIELNKEISGRRTVKRAVLDKKFNFTGIVGESTQMTSVLETIGRVCKTDAPVLILGESGTGKELVAEAIHKNSNRNEAAFVKVNLGGISSGVFESEMFGHRKGSFTDAYSDRKGRFEIADRGTIFLDEIGDLDFNSQVKLLRVLQDKTYQVLGESNTRKTDIRIICATNRNLQEMVRKGTFREDLLYRINLITIELPPLRERPEDIPPIVAYFLQGLKKIYDTGEVIITDKTLKWLQNLSFPGNIRELRNLVERTWLLSGKNKLEITDFEKALEQPMGVSQAKAFSDPQKNTLEDIEKELIIKTIEKCRNNLTKVAKSLGLSRGALYRRLEKYNIPLNSEQ
jgi:DNA-binding NtrC family response regulator